jgi:hypothetical protein
MPNFANGCHTSQIGNPRFRLIYLHLSPTHINVTQICPNNFRYLIYVFIHMFLMTFVISICNAQAIPSDLYKTAAHWVLFLVLGKLN